MRDDATDEPAGMQPGTSRDGYPYMQEVQRLQTTGARSAAVRADAQGIVLAIAQFARDIPGQQPGMHAGDSDVTAPWFEWSPHGFTCRGQLPLPGGESLELFRIGERRFIAGASIRTGAGPYEMNVHSWIREWIDGETVPLQSIPTFGAKQWRHFHIGPRHFLALAQGVEAPGPEPRHPRTSRIFEWDGAAFRELQSLPGRWGYGWQPFELAGGHFLAYADHLQQSVIYRWNGDRFEEFQALPGGGGRAFVFFRHAGGAWLVHANLQRGTELYRWEAGAFVLEQSLGDPGARALAVVEAAGRIHLVKVNFIHGTPANPQRIRTSQLYSWTGSRLELLESFATSAATDVAAFSVGTRHYVVVTNALDALMRFSADTVVYELRP